ncbi:MAG TPA: 16S rRNA (cytosine(967)-C(5))-methyltransferase RsmB [Blastocatellia bacterium]|nr:16S rRNA (cytosine(967)-C(5))-methyltransferase RsmB [Blastocatellia bacterium]
MTRSKTSAPSPARRVAFDVLRRVETESAYASVLLASIARETLSADDLALATEITLGVLRWRKTLDHLIELDSNRRIDRLDMPVVIALRIGLYQLRYLDRVPASAAVNESVKLVKYAKVASAGSLVNAVLRRAAGRAKQAAGAELTDPLERLAVQLSHPRWLLERWVGLLGEQEAAQLAAANNLPPATAFRINVRSSANTALALLETEGVRARPSPLVDGAFVVESGRITPDSEAVTRGLIYLQDEASQAVSLMLDPQPGERVLDLCAAPGSKTTHIASLARDQAWVIACDLRPRRLLTLTASCRRLGLTSIDALAADAGEPLPFAERSVHFDRVLVDAPCSGTGTLRQNPEIRWRLAGNDIARLSQLQLMLLGRGSLLVRDGGRLVYSTCSIEPEENEDVVSQFLRQNPQFRVTPPRNDQGISPELITKSGFMRTFPHRHGTDGFFAAVLQRQE